MKHIDAYITERIIFSPADSSDNSNYSNYKLIGIYSTNVTINTYDRLTQYVIKKIKERIKLPDYIYINSPVKIKNNYYTDSFCTKYILPDTTATVFFLFPFNEKDRIDHTKNNIILPFKYIEAPVFTQFKDKEFIYSTCNDDSASKYNIIPYDYPDLFNVRIMHSVKYYYQIYMKKVKNIPEPLKTLYS